jgi:hypothetical protein
MVLENQNILIQKLSAMSGIAMYFIFILKIETISLGNMHKSVPGIV